MLVVGVERQEDLRTAMRDGRLEHKLRALMGTAVSSLALKGEAREVALAAALSMAQNDRCARAWRTRFRGVDDGEVGEGSTELLLWSLACRRDASAPTGRAVNRRCRRSRAAKGWDLETGE